jgi:electron transfer flavoprotein alpha subunit
MAVLVYVDNSNGQIPNSSKEAVYYASQIANSHSSETVAVVVGTVDNEALEALGNFGADKVLCVNNSKLNHFDSQTYTQVIASAVSSEAADVIIFSHGYTSKSVGPRLSAQLKAGMVVNVVDYPKQADEGILLRRTVFSGKAFADVTLTGAIKIIAIQSNSFSPEVTDKNAEVEELAVSLSDNDVGVTVKEINKETDKVSLTEAEVVVSGGRGLKAAENWNLVEEMADLLGAATSCSKPVADMGWRPHSEHVGQTGVTVRPNLYIAIGISGAIQHLAGVNGSKYIVAINTDPEAPIFKAADYGIIGDAFKVVPELNQALKELNS